MKKIFSFTKKKKGFSPNSSDTGSVLSVGYEIKDKDLHKVHKAASSGDLSRLKQLSKKNDINQLDKENRTPLHIACANGHTEVVQFLVESKAKLNLCDNQHRSPLMKAVQCQQERCALVLLEHGADPNLVDMAGNTALHLAVLGPFLPLAIPLLEHGADINAQNKDGCTPLILTVTENHTEMAEFLLKEGAEVNAQDLGKRTSLMIAACNGQVNLIRLLLAYDADIAIKDEKGWTSDDYAVINGHHACSHLIIEHGTQKKPPRSPSVQPLSRKQKAPDSPDQGAEAAFSLGRPATNREVEDNSQAESVSRASKSEVGDSWPSSDEEGLDFSPKKPQKLNLKELISASEKAKKNAIGDPVKTWTDHESEREREDKVERNPVPPATFPSSGNFQLPESPSPPCISKPPLLTSTPLRRSGKAGDYTEDDDDDDDEDEEDEEDDELGDNAEGRDFVTDENRPHDAGDVVPETSERVPNDVKRDFLSELGLEEDADEEDGSNWDSSASDSPRKRPAVEVNWPVKAEQEAARFSEAVGSASSNGPGDNLQRKTGAELPVRAVTKEIADANRKMDFMEDLGLGDVDDLEESQKKRADPSDWDSTSTASRELPACTEALPPLETLPIEEEPGSSPPTPSLQAVLSGKVVDVPSVKGGGSADTSSCSEDREDREQGRATEDKGCSRQALGPEKVREEEEMESLGAVQRKPKTPHRNGTAQRERAESAPVKEEVSVKRNASLKCSSTYPERDSKALEEKDAVDRGVLTPQVPPLEWSAGAGPRPQQAARANGDPLSAFEDSTLSELSDDDGRFAATRKTKQKVAREEDVRDDFDDFTQSSDTGTEEADSPASGYRNASLLVKQLEHSGIDSVSMVKVQNMFHEYERAVRRERGRSEGLLDKVSRLEEERTGLRHVVTETREAKASLEHRQVELETDLSNLRFALKQEEEKRRNASSLYERSREQLRQKEAQYRAEADERQKLELAKSNMELEMRALASSLKQLEDDHSESQRLLTHERSARAVQEGILNSHLRKQKEMEEETRRSISESSQLIEPSARNKELVQQNQRLQEEATGLQLELERSRAHGQQEQGRLSEDNEALRERLADTKRDLKLSEEALAQTVYQFNGQVGSLKAELSVASAKLDQERQAREKLEAEVESARGRLSAALQEVERSQAARANTERTLQRDRDDWRRAQERADGELGGQREAVQGLSRQLAKAEERANSLENECHRTSLSLTEKGLLLEALQREREQAQGRAHELESALRTEREQVARATARQEATQERLAQALSDVVLLRQQAEEAHNKGVVKERVAADDAQRRFAELLAQLRANADDRVRMAEERSRELLDKNTELREQLGRQEQERSERETALRHLQQELADALKKLSMSEASLEVNSRYRSDLEEEKGRMQREAERLRGKLQESEEQQLQAEKRVHELRSALDDRERELIASSQKLQESLAVRVSTEKTVQQLEETVQRLEIENARLEASAKHQAEQLDALQKSVQEGAATSHPSPGRGVRTHLEDLVINLQGSKMNLEDQLSREVQKQGVLSHNVQDSHRLWEDELNSRSRLSLRLAELEKEKGELLNQIETEKKKVKKIAEQKKTADVRLDQEMKRNTELQKEMHRLKMQVKTAKRKLKGQDGTEPGSPFGVLQGESGTRRAGTEDDDRRIKARVDELSLQLDRQRAEFRKLEALNVELREQLSSLKALGSRGGEQERSKKQLEEEVTSLRRQVDSCMLERSHAEQYRREAEERARREVHQKLEEVNYFLQTQAASQDTLEQMRAANEASLRTQLDRRIRDLEDELSQVRSAQQDSVSLKDSAQAELQRYRELYSEEMRMRKSLAAKLERANERLAETNARLLSDRQRSHPLLTSSMVNSSFASPSFDTGLLSAMGPYGASRGPLNPSLGLANSFSTPAGNEESSRMEAYLAKMQRELEKNISKELDRGTVELEGHTARMSPVGSAVGYQRRLSLDQEPVSRATQQYLEILKKNYKI